MHPTGERPAAAVGPLLDRRPVLSAPAGNGLRLVAWGPDISLKTNRVCDGWPRRPPGLLEAQRLTAEAARAEDLADIDRVRTALLAAVGHDLRTPLAGIKAAVSGLRQPGPP